MNMTLKDCEKWPTTLCLSTRENEGEFMHENEHMCNEYMCVKCVTCS